MFSSQEKVSMLRTRQEVTYPDIYPPQTATFWFCSAVSNNTWALLGWGNEGTVVSSMLGKSSLEEREPPSELYPPVNRMIVSSSLARPGCQLKLWRCLWWRHDIHQTRSSSAPLDKWWQLIRRGSDSFLTLFTWISTVDCHRTSIFTILHFEPSIESTVEHFPGAFCDLCPLNGPT